MKIYISCDAEGISGVFKKPEEVNDYRLMMTHDVNAAVAGAREGGATEVVVWDTHAKYDNLVYEELVEGAEYIQGYPAVERLPCLDESFAGVFLIGYHAMAGTMHAVCDHTMSSAMWQHIWVNGRELGEIGLDALWAGRCGVPVLMVSGDDKACTEATDVLGEIEAAQVKVGLGRHSARMLSPAAARERIRKCAQSALSKVGSLRPFTMNPPYEVKLKYASTAHLDGILFDGQRRERLDGQTIVYRTDNLIEALARQP